MINNTVSIYATVEDLFEQFSKEKFSSLLVANKSSEIECIEGNDFFERTKTTTTNKKTEEKTTIKKKEEKKVTNNRPRTVLTSNEAESKLSEDLKVSTKVKIDKFK
jgi:hypothetical protein